MLDLVAATNLIDERWDYFLSLLESLEDPNWDLPTRLHGWAIRDLVSHVTWGVGMEADAIRKMKARDPTPAGEQGVDATAPTSLLIDAVAHRSQDLVSQLRTITADDLGEAAPMPYGSTPVPVVLQIFSMEAAVHTDDLAHALGIDSALSEEAVTATMSVMGGSLPILAAASTTAAREGGGYHLIAPGVDVQVARRGGSWVLGDPGDETTVISGERSPLTLFVMGRIKPTDLRLSITGSGPPAADFKAHFPGP